MTTKVVALGRGASCGTRLLDMGRRGSTRGFTDRFQDVAIPEFGCKHATLIFLSPSSRSGSDSSGANAKHSLSDECTKGVEALLKVVQARDSLHVGIAFLAYHRILSWEHH